MRKSESSPGPVAVSKRAAQSELLRRALDGVPLEPLTGPAPNAELAILDLSQPEEWGLLKRLGPSLASKLISALAVVGDDEESTHLAYEMGAADILHVSRVEAELRPRLKQLAARHWMDREGQRRQRDLALLLQLTATYASSLDPEALLHDVTRRLAAELSIERATLIVLDEAQHAGFILAASDDPKLKGQRIELVRYPEIVEVARTKKPVIVEDAPSHPLLESVKANIAARGIRALAALPLAVSGKVLGVLLVRASDKRAAFSLREIDFLATVANATAVALRNARLLERLRGETEAEKSGRIAAEERALALARYEGYFVAVSEGVAVLDDKATVLSLNPAACRLLDVSNAEARGRHINVLTRPAEESGVTDLLRGASFGDSPGDVDLAVRTVGGRKLTLSFNAAPLKDGSASTLLSFRDVTAARAMSEELRHTKEFLERLIDSSVDGIIAADMQGRILLFNKGAEEVTGFSAWDAVGRLNVRDFYLPGDAEKVMSKLRENGGQMGVTRMDIVTRPGDRVPINLTASVVVENGREVATVGIFTDMRAWMLLEKKLSETEVRLEESERNAALVALAGTAAHELNQPLTSVMGYSELLRRKLTEADFAYRPVDIIYREAERMAEIVRKIGKITRYETKNYVGTAQIIDLDKASSHED